MVLAIRHRAIYYRRYELDIWGILRTSAFRYTVKKKKPWRRKRFSRSHGRPLVVTRARSRYFVKTKKSKDRKKAFGPVSVQGRSAKKLVKKHKRVLATINRSKKTYLWPLHRLPKKITSYFFITLFYGKLMRIFDFFYSNHLKKQQQRARARRRYIYRLDVIQRRTFKKKLKKRFVSLRLVKLFYITLHYHQFRQLARRTRRLEGCFEHNYFLALEGRLASFVYRTAMAPNLFICIKLVRDGGVIIGRSCQNHIGYNVQVNGLVNFTQAAKRLIYFSLLYRLARKLILFNPPRYMFVSYIFLFAYMKRPPHRKDLVFPISLDLHRASGYAF
jgi:ribosomal protein S4